MELNIHGLKCDAPGCGWADMSIPLAKYHVYVGAACPDCGADILTEADYRYVVAMVRVNNMINTVGAVIQGLTFGLIKPGKPKTVNHIDLNGSGKPSIRKEPANDK